ncbi:hypothetical protein [Nocardia nepalensis]|uniref:hypothetical protein n=1 Tax=Nocardia nepalensis TaxID=3375448 RepID=UPI003B685C63
MAVDTSLPSRPDAPILNAYIGHIEAALARLVKAVGDGSAKSITVKGLDGLGDSQLKTGDLVAKYHAKQSDDTKYRDDLNALDTKIVGIAGMAQKSADLANTVYTEVETLVGTAKGTIASVPQNPDIGVQLSAIGSIDKAVSTTADHVSSAYDEMNEHAGGVGDPSPRNNYMPTSGGGGGGGSYVPPNGPSYDRQYTAPVSATNGGGPNRRLSEAEVDYYIGKALDALGITDPVARQRWTEGYRTLIERESSRYIGSINLEDSNAVAGHPSQGLTQTIPSTFAAYHVAGTSSNITDPTANIAASMNYVMDVYHVGRDGSNLTSNVQQADAGRPSRGY